MDRVTLEKKLESLRKKQDKLEAIWNKTGNRELIQFFIDIMPRVLDVERCSIFILDPEEDTVWLQCGTGLPEKAVSVSVRGSIVGNVIATGRVYMEMDLQSSVGEHDVVGVKTGFLARNTLCVPIYGVTTERITGAVQVLNKRTGSVYSPEDKVLLERFAQNLALNIENIFLRQEYGKILQEMKKKIASLEKMLGRSSAV
jgi:Nif-specific regulatory protein/two-component system response regulator HydG